jgi:hypothetical protein
LPHQEQGVDLILPAVLVLLTWLAVPPWHQGRAAAAVSDVAAPAAVQPIACSASKASSSDDNI